MSSRRARQGGICRLCMEPYEAGAWVYFQPRTRSNATHIDCERKARTERRTQQPATPAVPASSTHVAHYDSIDAMLVDANAPHPSNATNWSERKHVGGAAVRRGTVSVRTWTGVDTIAECDRLIASAQWPEGAAMVRSLADSLLDIAPPVNVKRRRVWADQGDSFDLHRAYSGRLDAAWQRTKRQSARAPRPVRIVLDANHTFRADAANLQWAGAAVVALSDLLTESGYSPEIILGFSHIAASPERERVQCTLQVKSPLMPLDINALAATVALPGFVRQVMYQLIVHFAPHIRDALSWPQELPTEAGDIVARTAQIVSEQEARAWIESAIAKVNRTDEQAAA